MGDKKEKILVLKKKSSSKEDDNLETQKPIFEDNISKDDSLQNKENKEPKQNNKKKKKPKTKVEKKKRRRKHRIIRLSILGAIVLAWGIIAITTLVGQEALLNSLNSVSKVDYTGINIIKPQLDEDGYPLLDEDGNYNFIDHDGELDRRNFNVLQITDVHIGAGAFSLREDAWTVQTVVDIVQKVKPDLVVTTGDIAYPVWPQSGTLNNLKEAMVFANLMEKLNVYWTFTFGNHDTEAYSFYNRYQIADFYDNKEEFPHCLFSKQPKYVEGEEIMGAGNFAINLKNKNKELVHTLFMVDSNMYLPDDPWGAKWHYDRIHDDQILWYEDMSKKLGLIDNENATSTLYFHIPIKEYRDVYEEWRQNDKKDSDTIRLINGYVGEDGRGALGTEEPSNIIDTALKCGTTGLFCGHDHKNNSSFLYDKDGIGKGNIGVKLTYGMSIDYLAYPGIFKEVAQRGARMIEINNPNNLKVSKRSQDKMTKEEFEFDQPFGFTTYNLPYWHDLYRE